MAHRAFVPRSLASRPQNSPAPSVRVAPAPTRPPSAVGKKRKSINPRVIVAVCELCLSPYAIVHDLTLLNSMRANSGFVSLRSVLDRAWPDEPPPDAPEVSRILREHSTVLQVRVLISRPGRDEWLGDDAQVAGGFEVRRLDWSTLSIDSLRATNWTPLTVYVENLPPNCRSLSRVVELLLVLLSDEDAPVLAPQLQSVQFPVHVNARPGEEPRCKGFARVVLETPAYLSRLVSAWQWSQSAQPSPTAHPLHIAVFKSGFRCLSLAHFEQLQQEYLDWQELLASNVSGRQEAHVATTSLPKSQAHRDLEKPVQVQTTATAAFPRNRLVIARNIPVDSTKTSLRSLFEQALSGRSDAIQYIDYVKNCDWCHVRLSSSEHAHQLVQALTQSNAQPAIRGELVVGIPEEAYWEKVPPRLRFLDSAQGDEGKDASEKPARKRARK